MKESKRVLARQVAQELSPADIDLVDGAWGYSYQYTYSAPVGGAPPDIGDATATDTEE